MTHFFHQGQGPDPTQRLLLISHSKTKQITILTWYNSEKLEQIFALIDASVQIFAYEHLKPFLKQFNQNIKSMRTAMSHQTHRLKCGWGLQTVISMICALLKISPLHISSLLSLFLQFCHFPFSVLHNRTYDS